MTGPEIIGDILNHEPNVRKSKVLPDEPLLSPRDQLVLGLCEVGIGLRKAESLVNQYPEDKIRQQLAWLPFRAARRPASLLITAIEQDYDPPVYANE